MSSPFFSELPLHVMNISALADQCTSEIGKYRHGEPYHDRYCLELFRRALVQCDSPAWEVVQHVFNETMIGWMRSHPLREVACRFENEENYVAHAFTLFRKAIVGNQKAEIPTLAAALQYLRASLNAALLDTLRTCSWSKRKPLSEPDESGKPFVENRDAVRAVREVIRDLLPGEREQRLAYLLFHCGLCPREIVRLCPQEFSEIGEIHRLRRNIFERLLPNADRLPLGD
jgi:hypothetical protein